MVIYWDLLILLNLLTSFLLFHITNRLFHYGIKNFALVVAALVESMMFLLMLTLENAFGISHLAMWMIIFIHIIVSKILFRIVSIKQLLKTLAIHFLICLIMAGIFLFVGQFTENVHLLALGIGSFVFLELTIDEIASAGKMFQRKEMCFYEIELHKKSICGTSIVRAEAFLDSGNALWDPISGSPVCLATEAFCKRLLGNEDIKMQRGYRMIPYSSVGKKQGLLEAFMVDEVICINDGKKHFYDVLFAVCTNDLSNKGEFQVIWNPKLI